MAKPNTTLERRLRLEFMDGLSYITVIEFVEPFAGRRGSALDRWCRSRIAMKTSAQRLYVVVHHRRDADQSFVNSWLDDERLEAITTTPEIGRFCLDAQQRGEIVCVHRCGWSDVRPTICSSASVVRVDSVDRRTSLVSFADQKILARISQINFTS